RCRLRIVRAGDRRPRQKHPPQTRTAPRRAALPANRPRRRLPLRRIGDLTPMPRPPWRGPESRPPWWPEGESWPPPPAAWHGARQRFLRRVGCLLGVLVLLFVATSVIAVNLFGGGFDESSGPPWPVRALFGLVIFLIVATIVRRVV